MVLGIIRGYKDPRILDGAQHLVSWAWKQRNVGSEKNLKIAGEGYCGFSVERRPLLGCGLEMKIKQIDINSKYAVYYLPINSFQIHCRMKGLCMALTSERYDIGNGEDKEAESDTKVFISLDIGKIVVTASEMVKFRKARR